ncbi:hypothetical protein [Pseudomonas petroselini]
MIALFFWVVLGLELDKDSKGIDRRMCSFVDVGGVGGVHIRCLGNG